MHHSKRLVIFRAISDLHLQTYKCRVLLPDGMLMRISLDTGVKTWQAKAATVSVNGEGLSEYCSVAPSQAKLPYQLQAYLCAGPIPSSTCTLARHVSETEHIICPSKRVVNSSRLRLEEMSSRISKPLGAVCAGPRVSNNLSCQRVLRLIKDMLQHV